MYAGGSVGVELDVTVPPWSGQDDLTFSFEPEELVGDHTRPGQPFIKIFRMRNGSTTGGESVR